MNKIIFNKIVSFRIVFFLLIFSSSVFAQINHIKKENFTDDKYLIYDARLCIKSGEYSRALKFAEDAKNIRKNQVTFQVRTLENAFKPMEVKRKNNVLSDIINTLQKRQDYNALDIIDFYVQQKSLNYFDNSSKNLISYILSRESFPEADWIIANVYKLEGEYNLAKQYLLSALENESLLDVNSEKYDIMYELADISFIEKNMEDYEKYLLLVLSDDSNFKNDSYSDALMNVVKSGGEDVLEKFFLLFRNKNYKALRSYLSLSEYYETLEQKERAVKLSALAALTSFSKIYTVITERNVSFEYSDCASLLKEMSNYSDVCQWALTNNVWKNFLDFADKIRGLGYNVFADKMYSLVATHSPSEYWKDIAKRGNQ